MCCLHFGGACSVTTFGRDLLMASNSLTIQGEVTHLFADQISVFLSLPAFWPIRGLKALLFKVREM